MSDPPKKKSYYEKTLFRYVKKTERTCLKCNKLFMSTGPGNRICINCNSLNEKHTHVRTYDDSIPRRVGPKSSD